MTTDVPDTDVAVRLTDVYPDGRSMLVADSIMRAGFYDSPDFSSETQLTPGEAVKLSFDLGPTSIVFNAGHRIRISVGGSNALRFAPNPNTGESFLQNGESVQVAHTTILHNAESSPRSSCLCGSVRGWTDSATFRWNGSCPARSNFTTH